MRRFNQHDLSVYTSLASQPCGVGFRSLSNSLRRKPQSPHQVCGFFVRSPSFRRLEWGGLGPAGFTQVGSRSSNPSSRRPRLEASASVVANRTDLEAIMAQPSTSSLRGSALVILLPNAAAPPVLQTRGPGRYPRQIVNMRRWRSDHARPTHKPAPVAVGTEAGLQEAYQFMRTCNGLYQRALSEWMVAQQRAGRPVSSVVS
jgi:hypothetical protein